MWPQQERKGKGNRDGGLCRALSATGRAWTFPPVRGGATAGSWEDMAWLNLRGCLLVENSMGAGLAEGRSREARWASAIITSGYSSLLEHCQGWALSAPLYFLNLSPSPF